MNKTEEILKLLQAQEISSIDELCKGLQLSPDNAKERDMVCQIIFSLKKKHPIELVSIKGSKRKAYRLGSPIEAVEEETPAPVKQSKKKRKKE